MIELRLHIPAQFLPYPPWSINDERRQHWSWRSERSLAYKQAAYLAATRHRNGHRAPWDGTPAYVIPVLRFPRNQRRDPHNYTSTTIKSLIDGLVMAGWWPDDNSRFVTVTDPQIVAPAQDHSITLTLRARRPQ